LLRICYFGAATRRWAITSVYINHGYMVTMVHNVRWVVYHFSPNTRYLQKIITVEYMYLRFKVSVTMYNLIAFIIIVCDSWKADGSWWKWKAINSILKYQNRRPFVVCRQEQSLTIFDDNIIYVDDRYIYLQALYPILHLSLHGILEGFKLASFWARLVEA